LIAGGAIGFALAWFVFGRSKGVPSDQYDGILKEKIELSDKVLGLAKDVSRLEAEKSGLQEKLDVGKADFDNLQQKFEDRFKILAHDILEDQSKNTWDVKEAKSVAEAQAYMGSSTSDIGHRISDIGHGQVISVEAGTKPDWWQQNWYKIITATAVIAGVYVTVRR